MPMHAPSLENKINPKPGEAIPTEDIAQMVDVLINVARNYPPDSMMHASCVSRAQHYMDVVDSWRSSCRPLQRLPPGEPDPRD